MSTPTPNVRPLEGEEVLTWLRRNEVRSYRYQPNVPGNYFLLTVALIASSVAVLLAVTRGFSRPIHVAAILALLGFAGTMVGLVVYWFRFVVRSYVALTDDEILVGYGKSGHVIEREHLTREHVQVENMKAGKYTMVLPIVIGDQSWSVHLIGPFANLKALQAFIAEMLMQFLEDDGDGEALDGDSEALDGDDGALAGDDEALDGETSGSEGA